MLDNPLETSMFAYALVPTPVISKV